jgi:hypothetical protein
MRAHVAVAFSVLVALASPAGAQQEQGDLELQFTGSLLTVVGQADVSITSGIFQSKVGYFVTDRIELGAFPSLLYSRTETGEWGARVTTSETKFGMGLFAVHSFLAADARTVPYLGTQFYRIDLADPDESGWLGVNGGVKFYLTRRTAFDAGANYLFGLGERGGALVLFQMGLGVLF